MKSVLRTLTIAASLLVLTAPAHAATAEKTAAFRLDQWVELGSTDGPVTLHRIRLVKGGEGIKSKMMRPNNSEYLEDVQIQLEFTNAASSDWEVRLRFEWVDADGKVIDGYDDEEGLDSDSRHEIQTVTLSTLKYGLQRAKTLKIHLEYYPD